MFETAKAFLQSDTLLVHYDPQKELTLVSDASPYGLGAKMAQRMGDGIENPVAFASKTLAPAENCSHGRHLFINFTEAINP